MTNKILNPEFEAKIYYLKEDEGGRKSPVQSGYRGQFYYNGNNWDASQEFLDKQFCSLGESVKVNIQTFNPDYHVGQLSINQEFEIREDDKIVGKGKILKILREDFNYWEIQSFFRRKAFSLKPYSSADMLGYQIDFDLSRIAFLQKTNGVKDVKVIKTDQKECMIKITCLLFKDNNNDRLKADKIIEWWKNSLAFNNQLYKVNIETELNKRRYILSFATWHSMYLTGQIIIE